MSTRNQSLDVLRGIAVLLVMGYHYPVLSVMKCGWVGVDLFFVLSGFLISGLLFADIEKNGKIRFARFYVRRGFKIYPPFFCLLIITSLAIPAHRKDLWIEFAFLQNYLRPSFIGVWGHTWSLAVEEHFYIALPLLLAVLNRSKLMRLVPAISLLLIFGCIAMRVYLPHESDYRSISFPTHLRMDALFAGVALGYFFHSDKLGFLGASRWWMLPLSILCMLPGPLMSVGGIAPLFSYSFNIVGFSLLLLWALPRSMRWMKPVAFIGRYSYSIYLWHVPVGTLIGLAFSWRMFCLYAAASLATGVIAAEMVEMPFLRLRDKFTRHAIVFTPNSAALAAETVQAEPVFGSLSRIP